MKIAFSPFDSVDKNSYVANIKTALTLAYPNADIVPLPSIRNWHQFKDIDYVWFNWFENFPIRWNQWWRCLLWKLAIICIIRICHIKVISVLHNREPHETLCRPLIMWMYKSQLKNSYRIITLCKEGENVISKLIGTKYLSKSILIPHPKYECPPRIYPQCDAKPQFSISFFGLLRPYKNIETIIEVAHINPNIQFTIAGKPYTKMYEEELNRLTSGCKNVSLKFGFLTDEDINCLMDNTSILILPYKISSSLNSGVAMYSLSKGVNLIIPEIGTIKDLRNKALIYTYNSSDNSCDVMKREIQALILKAYRDYNDNYDEYVGNINTLRSEIQENFCIDNIAKLLQKLNLY